MIPAGYMYKHVATNVSHLQVADVRDIYSVSGCISDFFADYVGFWKHNGYWFFDSPAIIEELAAQQGIDLSEMTLFYYEVYEEEFDENTHQWSLFAPDEAFPTNILVPKERCLKGFDAVTFSVRTLPECSPLSCNHVATETSVNRHCLFNTFEETKYAIENGVFDRGEPGPFRIFAVYTPGMSQCA